MNRVVAIVQLAAVACTSAFVVMLFANEPDDAAPTPDGSAGEQAAPAADAAAPDGQELFTSRCGGCHGADGGGGVGPRLAGRMAQRFPDIDDQITVVRDGRGGMPSFRGRLSDEEIRAIVEYTRSL